MTGISVPMARDIGSPIEPPAGSNPLLSGLGPAAYADRADRPDLTIGGHPKIVPLSVDPDFYLEPRDPDPRGFRVIGCDGEAGGTVVDVWVDRSEPQVRYLELEASGRGGRVLLPITFCTWDVTNKTIRVKAIKGAHFADVPKTRASNQVTLLEEDRIQAYYAGGYLYADPSRLEPGLI